MGESESRSVVSDSLWPHGYSPWNSLGQKTRVGSLSLLQGILPTQGSNSGLPWRWIPYQLSHQESPRILEWLVYPFSSGSSWPRYQTRVSCVAGRFLPTELSGKPILDGERVFLKKRSCVHDSSLFQKWIHWQVFVNIYQHVGYSAVIKGMFMPSHYL